MTCELAHFLRDATRPAGFDHADGEAAQAGDVFRAVAGADAAAVFIIIPIENVMATVLDDPMSAIDLENALRAGLGGGSTGEAVGDFPGSGAGLFLGHVPLDDESLLHSGESQDRR